MTIGTEARDYEREQSAPRCLCGFALFPTQDYPSPFTLRWREGHMRQHLKRFPDAAEDTVFHLAEVVDEARKLEMGEAS